MLVSEELPAVLGGTAPTMNIGELETKGFELTLGWRDKINDFGYGITFMLSDNRNKLLSLKGSDTKAEGRVFAREGYPINSYFGYESLGIIKTEQQLEEYRIKHGGIVPTAQLGLGDMMYRDIDGDGVISPFGADGMSGDLKYLGTRNPRHTFSTNINLSYKNFDFNMFLQGVGTRHTVRVGNFMAPFTERWWQPMAYFHGKTWTADRPDATIPRIINGGGDVVRTWNYRFSDSPHRLIDDAYLRVKLMTLAYNVPQGLCNRLNLGSLRVYVSGQDLLTFARGSLEKTYDPEDGWVSEISPGGSDITYPFAKIVSFGLDIRF